MAGFMRHLSFCGDMARVLGRTGYNVLRLTSCFCCFLHSIIIILSILWSYSSNHSSQSIRPQQNTK